MRHIIRVMLLITLVGVSTAQVMAQAVDRVRQGATSVAGKIIEVSPTKVVIEANSISKDIEVNTITGVTFAGEPRELIQAKTFITNGRYDEAKELLDKINAAEIERKEIKEDVDYFKAFCNAKLALDSKSAAAAGSQMLAFLKQSDTSYHFFEATEIVGDLLVMMGRHKDAITYYDRLSASPWPDFKMKGGVLVGRALQAEKQHAEAITRFDAVLAINADTPEGKRSALAATLGKAVSLADGGKVPEAIKMVEKVIEMADPEESELHARAYNALGQCQLKAGKNKEALLAFLHVDVLYYTSPEAHAEALANLAKLWETLGKPDRAREANLLLQERYSSSPWAKQGG